MLAVVCPPSVSHGALLPRPQWRPPPTSSHTALDWLLLRPTSTWHSMDSHQAELKDGTHRPSSSLAGIEPCHLDLASETASSQNFKELLFPFMPSNPLGSLQQRATDTSWQNV